MAIISSLNTQIVISDGTAAFTKATGPLAFTGINETYTSNFTIGTSPVSITIPKSPAQLVHIRNMAPAGVSAPVAAPTLSTIAGTLGATTYYVKTTYVNAFGETVASSEATIVAGANTSLVVQSPPALGSATGWNVYIANTSGGTGTETQQNVSGAIAIGTAWTQSIALIAGSALPGANTTAAVVTVTWTKQGGSSLAVQDLVPGGLITFCQPTSPGGFTAPSAIGGVTAISLQSSIAATPVEMILGG